MRPTILASSRRAREWPRPTNRRFGRPALGSLALGITALCGLGYAAWAQQAQGQLDLALQRLRAALGPGTTLTYAGSSLGPDGHAVLSEVRVRRGHDTLDIRSLELAGARPDGVDEAVARDLRFAGQDRVGTVTLARLTLHGLALPQRGDGSPQAVSFTLDRGEFEQLRLENPVHTSATVASGSLSGLQPGRAARAELHGLEIRPHDTQELRSLRLGQLMAAVPDAAPLLDALRDRHPPRPAGTLTVEATQIAADSYAGALGGADALRTTLEQQAPDRNRFSLAVEGLRPGEATAVAATLQGLGYGKVAARLALEVRQDPGPANPARFHLRLDADGVARTEFELALDGVPHLADSGALADTFGIRLGASRLVYEDASLLRRYFSAEGKRHGLPADAVRDGYVRTVELALGTGPHTTPEEAALRDALVAFLRNPGTITVRARPPQPLPLLAIPSIGVTPSAIIGSLGLSATASPPRDARPAARSGQDENVPGASPGAAPDMGGGVKR